MQESLNHQEIFRRQRNTYDPTKHNRPVHIVGCGSLGSYIGMFLAKLGLNEFHLYDSDTVAETNVANQSFMLADVGMRKTTALEQQIRMHSTWSRAIRNQTGHQPLSVTLHDAISADDLILDDDAVIFSVVDSILPRQLVYKNSADTAWIIDTRTGTEYYTVFPLDKANKENCKYYEEQAMVLPPGGVEDGDCTLQSIAYSTAMAAATAVGVYIRMCRGDKYPKNIEFDLRMFDLYANFQ